jgi:uncharacterized membrane protein YhiD involved in acid resistance
MFDFFPDQPAFQYPDFVNIVYSLTWAFLLSSMIAITHRLTFKGESYSNNFFQALILGSIVTAMVMMAVGDNLARGLGVFGAMAIIRFRTRIDDPRNVLFLFAALSCGLAVGVFGLAIAFAGTIFFCLAAFILHISSFKSFTHSHRVEITYALGASRQPVDPILRQYCLDYKQVGISTGKEEILKTEYTVVFRSVEAKNNLLESLHKQEGVMRVSVNVLEFDTNRI